MRVLRVELNGWTASFRNPLFISGFQPCLPIPPLSTIYGLLSAARGDYVLPEHASIGFLFFSRGKAIDLETVYEFGKTPLNAKSNVCKREFLVEPQLYLYTPELWLKPYFERPHYPLLLGRSTELATVAEIDAVDLIETDSVTYCNTLLPFPMNGIYGQIQALPTHFTPDRPRRPQGIRPFYLVTDHIHYSGQAWKDPEKNWGVFLH